MGPEGGELGGEQGDVLALLRRELAVQLAGGRCCVVEVGAEERLGALFEGERQLEQVERVSSLEQRNIPEDLDYDAVTGLGAEVRQTLKQVRPISLGQALRISGVTPAAISLLMVALEKRKRGRD